MEAFLRSREWSIKGNTRKKPIPANRCNGGKKTGKKGRKKVYALNGTGHILWDQLKLDSLRFNLKTYERTLFFLRKFITKSKEWNMHALYSKGIHWVCDISLDTRLITSKYCVIQTVCVFYLRLYEAGVSGVFISLAWQWWSRRTAINTHYTRPPTITCLNLHSPRKKHHNLWQYVTI